MSIRVDASHPTPRPASADIASLRIDAAFDRLQHNPGISEFEFSPDGRRLATLSNESGSNQVHVINLSNRQSSRITNMSGISSFRWIDDNHLLLLHDRDGNERTQISLLSLDKGVAPVRLTHDDRAIYRFGGVRDNQLLYATNEGHADRFDLYLQDLSSGQRRRIYEGDGSLLPRGFTHGGRNVTVSRGVANGCNELLSVDVASGRAVSLTARAGTGHFGSAKVLSTRPDGSMRMRVLTDVGRDFVNPAVLDTRDGSIRYLTDVKWDAEKTSRSPDKRFRVTRYNESGCSVYRITDIDRRKAKRVSGMPMGVVTGEDYSPDGKSMIFALNQPTQPASLWKLDLENARVTPYFPGTKPLIDPATLTPPQMISYRTFDGRQIPSLLFEPRASSLPPESVGRMPAVVYVHGGPEGQHRPRYDAVAQYLVSRGYTVMEPNPRGSVGFGKAFEHADDVDKRMDSIEDVAAAARYLAASGKVDPNRIAVMGGSYGGYMTMAQLAFHPELWAAGVEIVGMSNLKTFLENTGPWRRPAREAEYGRLKEDAQLLHDVSPITHIDNIKAPLMAIQGLNDPRVPAGEADQMVDELRQRGGTADYLLFPDEGHGIKKADNRARAYTAAGDFLDRHVKEKDSGP